jgi:outer membrane biosynthesis protein TonB
VIELMLEAERALAVGLLDQAERYYGQVVAADPKNAIAVVGLARVALERDDQLGAYLLARRALAMDPDNPMASHLSRRMAEQFQGRGEPIPADETPVPSTTPQVDPPPTPDTTETPKPSEAPHSPDRPRLVDRFLRRRR